MTQMIQAVTPLFLPCSTLKCITNVGHKQNKSAYHIRMKCASPNQTMTPPFKLHHRSSSLQVTFTCTPTLQ
ncbi:hypothetical protein VIGAN_10103100 [Vigna angularis var. angularis]|uniref:Uncharacterized protein n=1 Tax=Vigna angularis var. angularis TaxID=157739 RepID=A0A0S3T2X2_PHAAN|nr:hypothetical protein VIGAN_10103100 [Vigna angularis var. angularis]